MDRIADMLNMIKNAGNAKKATVVVPHSNLKRAILEALKDKGFVASIAEKTVGGHKALEVGIMYRGSAPRISGVARISKPSRRLYAGAKDLKPLKNGIGSYFLSTPKGIMVDTEAKKAMVGGELLFSIW